MKPYAFCGSLIVCSFIIFCPEMKYKKTLEELSQPYVRFGKALSPASSKCQNIKVFFHFLKIKYILHFRKNLERLPFVIKMRSS